VLGYNMANCAKKITTINSKVSVKKNILKIFLNEKYKKKVVTKKKVIKKNRGVKRKLFNKKFVKLK
jgi:hypothetical protein